MEEYQERMLQALGDAAVTELVSDCTDPLLRNNRNEHRRFASRLLAIGVACSS